jgi:hypothetical protein
MAKQFRFVDINNADEAWQILHSLADKASPDIVKAFLQTVLSVKSGVPVAKIEKLLKTYNVERVLQSFNWEEIANTEFTPEVRKSLRDVFEAAGSSNTLPVRGTLDFDIVNPRVFDFIKNEVGNLITNVNLETVNAVRESIKLGFQNGKGPRVIAEEIKEYIGLNTRQAGSFLKYKYGLEGQGMNPNRIAKLTESYYKKLVKERALLIARTETINAAAAGYREQLIQASEQGLLDASKWEVMWLVTPDDRLCPLCQAMSGKRREINGVYQDGPGAGKNCPTLHPRCRCAERTIRKASKLKLVTAPTFRVEPPVRIPVKAPPIVPTLKPPVYEPPSPMYENIGTATPEFVEKLNRIASELPPEVKQTLADRGYHFRTGKFMTDIRPDLKGKRPPGWPKGSTYDWIEGVHTGNNRTVIVTEKIRRRRVISMNERPEGAVFHETGHAYDAALEWKSSTTDYRFAYNIDRNAIIKNSELKYKYAYELQGGGRGEREAFAEIFADVLGHPSVKNPEHSQEWPNVYKYMRGLLGK